MARRRVKIDALGREIGVMLNQSLSPQAQSRAFAQFSRLKLQEAQAQNRRVLGRVPNHRSYVDGRMSTNLDAVRPDGVIVFQFELLEQVFRWIRAELVKNSPVGQASDPRPGHPGMYRESHVFMADHVYVPPGAPLPPAKEYSFMSTVPYARKIERGLSDQAPSGVYNDVATAANARFGNIARIKYGRRDPQFGAIEAWAAATGMPSPGRTGRKRADWLRRQPAIIITPR